jgi:hypothetical protein
VVDPNERLACGPSNAFCDLHAHEQRAYEPWPIGHGHGSHVLDGDSRSSQSRSNDRPDVPKVVSRCELRHDAPEGRMDLDLRMDDVGVHAPCFVGQGGCRLVARRLDA